MRRPRIPRDLLDPVVDYFKPQRVILFGSRARGEATRDSDIDLLVVVDDDTPPEKLTSQAGYEAHRPRHAADVFPMPPKPSRLTETSSAPWPPKRMPTASSSTATRKERHR
jgi:hypothetical protein